MSRNLLQELINEHALIIEKLEASPIQLDNKEDSYHNLSLQSFRQECDTTSNAFEEYNNLCFVEYENKLQTIMSFFQGQEYNKELIVDNLRVLNVESTFKNNNQMVEASDSELIDEFTKAILLDFLNHQKQIDNFLHMHNLILPNNIKNFYIQITEAIEIEYTNWLHNKLFNKN